jgi:ribosomal protein L31
MTTEEEKYVPPKFIRCQLCQFYIASKIHPTDEKLEVCKKCYYCLSGEKSPPGTFNNEEHFVVCHLRCKFPNLPWQHDQTLGSMRKRPDCMAVLSDRVILVEIDQNSHKGYNARDEIEREDTITKFNRKPTYFQEDFQFSWRHQLEVRNL